MLVKQWDKVKNVLRFLEKTVTNLQQQGHVMKHNELVK